MFSQLIACSVALCKISISLFEKGVRPQKLKRDVRSTLFFSTEQQQTNFGWKSITYSVPQKLRGEENGYETPTVFHKKYKKMQ